MRNRWPRPCHEGDLQNHRHALPEPGHRTGHGGDRPGKIELAGSGTLFLDEIGELPLNLQGKLLGFLERKTYTRVGGKTLGKSGCRIIAATLCWCPLGYGSYGAVGLIMGMPSWAFILLLVGAVLFAVTIITGICLVSVFISYLAFRKGFTKSADDYFVAGSSLGYFVLIFSLLASLKGTARRPTIGTSMKKPKKP